MAIKSGLGDAEALNQPLDYSATSKTLAEASQAFDKSVRQLRQGMT